MTTTTQTLPALGRPGRSVADWLFAAVLMAVGGWALKTWGQVMDVYEIGILVFAIPSMIALGWLWSPLRGLMIGSGLATWVAMGLYMRATDDYGADLSKADQVFWLKYLLSSQSAILWMSVLFFIGWSVCVCLGLKTVIASSRPVHRYEPRAAALFPQSAFLFREACKKLPRRLRK
mgnify:CR=1 FL=1